MKEGVGVSLAFAGSPLTRISACRPQSSTAAARRASFNASAFKGPVAAPRSKQKTPERKLRGCQFQLIGMRSEVTGDAETALETSAGALPRSRYERPAAQDRPDIPAWCVLSHVLIHQLEVEVQVGDRVPADVRANQPSEGVGRDDAGANAPAGGDRAESAALTAPLDTADRAFKIGINGRRPVVLDQR